MDANEGTYLYCFTRAGTVQGLETAGVDDRPGIEEIAVGGSAAVCSQVSLAEFRSEPAHELPPDPEWLITRACRHEKVIEAVMARSPVLPVRFGAVFSSPGAVKAILAQQAPRIACFLEHVAEQEEWAVKGFVDAKTTEDWLLESDPALSARRRSLSSSPGTRYLQEKQLRAAVQQHVKQWCRSIATEVQASLREMATESRPLKIQPPLLSGHVGEMVLNTAFLLPRPRVAEFCSRVELVGACHGGEGLTLQCSGPWPPFSFCPSLEEAIV